MKIWIENQIGFLQGYSLMEQPDMLELEVEYEPVDFSNWRFDGYKLVYDPVNAPSPEPVPPSDLDLIKQQNARLTMEVVQIMLKLTELEQKVGISHE